MPTAANFNIPVLDRKEWQMMTPAPVATAAGMFVVAPQSGLGDLALFVTSATVHYLYSHKEDGWMQTTSGALAGAFAAGACGAYHPWSINYTANGGSTTTVTIATATHNITSEAVGKTIEFLTGTAANLGMRRVITGISNPVGSGTMTLTFDVAVPATVVNTDTFRLTTGRFYVLNAGTQAAGSFKVFDVGTMAWQANLTITGLPATWGTDGRLVTTARNPINYGNGTATSGSTTTVVDSSKYWATDVHVGRYVFLVDGTGEGQYAKITTNTATTLTFAAITTGATSGTVYRIGAAAPLAMGVATSGSATTLTNSGKSWTTNQWTNAQLRILSGTGAGQKSQIASNTGTVLTIPSGATLDNTSVYVIEPSDDYIYAVGNNAVTMYRYSIAANTWSTLAPGVARGGAPGVGMWADFVDNTGEALWANESDIQEGRYIYSGRGGATGTMDRYDIALNSWAAITYVNAETFTTGSGGFQSGRFIYLRKDATNRFFKYDIPGNELLPFNTNQYPDGAALVGQKIWVKSLDSTENVQWVYSLQNTGTALQRVGII